MLGVKTLKELFHDQHEIIPVKDGETLSLGNMDLTFMETRMIHWPDSMFTYLDKDELLFSQDAFGMHLATLERFAAKDLTASVRVSGTDEIGRLGEAEEINMDHRLSIGQKHVEKHSSRPRDPTGFFRRGVINSQSCDVLEFLL